MEPAVRFARQSCYVRRPPPSLPRNACVSYLAQCSRVARSATAVAANCGAAAQPGWAGQVRKAGEYNDRREPWPRH
eukprot:8879982-Alexandrium_andersonii.AAC.1